MSAAFARSSASKPVASSPRKPERPVFWIVGGPNGSGKSTLYNRTDIEGWGGSVWIINPDLLTAKIVEQEHLASADANLAAVQRIERWLDASIAAYQTIGVETVLSSDKYRRLIDLASRRGFDVRMIYVVLDSVDQQLGRIRLRVASGGHDVPAEKVASRRLRSFDQLAWFAQRVDQCMIFSDGGSEPELVAASVSRGPLWRFGRLPSDLADALARGGAEVAYPGESVSESRPRR